MKILYKNLGQLALLLTAVIILSSCEAITEATGLSTQQQNINATDIAVSALRVDASVYSENKDGVVTEGGRIILRNSDTNLLQVAGINLNINGNTAAFDNNTGTYLISSAALPVVKGNAYTFQLTHQGTTYEGSLTLPTLDIALTCDGAACANVHSKSKSVTVRVSNYDRFSETTLQVVRHYTQNGVAKTTTDNYSGEAANRIFRPAYFTDISGTTKVVFTATGRQNGTIAADFLQERFASDYTVQHSMTVTD